MTRDKKEEQMANGSAEAAELEATHRRCLECGQVEEGVDTWDPCEECDGDSFEWVHRTAEAGGFDDDDDFEMVGRATAFNRGDSFKGWEYPAAEPDGD
jgi:hypothetical protein